MLTIILTILDYKKLSFLFTIFNLLVVEASFSKIRDMFINMNAL